MITRCGFKKEGTFKIQFEFISFKSVIILSKNIKERNKTADTDFFFYWPFQRGKTMFNIWIADYLKIILCHYALLFCFILWKFEKMQQNPKWILLLIFLCFYELQNEQQMIQEKQKLLFSFFHSIHCISSFLPITNVIT